MVAKLILTPLLRSPINGPNSSLTDPAFDEAGKPALTTGLSCRPLVGKATTKARPRETRFSRIFGRAEAPAGQKRLRGGAFAAITFEYLAPLAPPSGVRKLRVLLL